MPTVGAVFGRYLLTDHLGGGAYGEVYKAFDSIQRDTVAVKIMKPGAVSSTAALVNEASRLTEVRGDNLLTIRNADTVSGYPFIAMDLADGAVTVPVQGTPPSEVIRIITQACAGIARIHDAGLLHCDIKPENLFIDGPMVRVGDLGLATERTGPSHNGGSPPTQAPEVAAARLAEAASGAASPGENSVASDVYALGATAYRLLTGRFPYDYAPPISTPVEYWTRVVTTDPPRLIDIAPHVPPLLGRHIETAMARNPTDRFTNPADFAAALSGLPRPHPTWQRTNQHPAHNGCWHAVAPGRAPLAVCVVPSGRNWNIQATRGARRHNAGCRTGVTTGQLPVRIRAALNSF